MYRGGSRNGGEWCGGLGGSTENQIMKILWRDLSSYHLKNQGRKAICEAGGKTSENASRFCDVKGTHVASVVGDNLTDHWDNLCLSLHLCSQDRYSKNT